jgi:hypothetical protein
MGNAPLWVLTQSLLHRAELKGLMEYTGDAPAGWITARGRGESQKGLLPTLTFGPP